MKKIILILLICFNAFSMMAQETLQSVTERGANTTKTISVFNSTKDNSVILNADLYDLPYIQGANSSQSSAKSLSINPNGGNVGIGTTAPNGNLDVKGTVVMGGSDANLDPAITSRNPSYLTNSGQMLVGWNRSSGGGEIDFMANQGGGGTGGFAFYNYSNTGIETQLMWIQGNGNIGIGTLTPDSKLAVNGTIHSKEVKVDLASWPDYVFAKSYQLPSLQETEKHIKEKGHLPGIPSSAEVKANGVDLGEMNAKLLQKIEELTLYLIEQNETIKEMKSRIISIEGNKKN